MQARFQQLRNDLFWEVWDSEQQKSIKWMGYDDYFWWNNVAKSEQFQIRGKYQLDPFTNEVRILTSRAVDEGESAPLQAESTPRTFTHRRSGHCARTSQLTQTVRRFVQKEGNDVRQ